MTQAATILIVDDDDEFRQLVRIFLEKHGYRVNEAADGDVALLVACATTPPQLILLDAEMPGLDGFEACRRFRLHPVTANTPVLMVTSFSDMGSVDKAYASGAEDFFSKPIQWSVFSQRIRHTIERTQSLQLLSDNEARFRRVWDGMPLSYQALDQLGTIQVVNQLWLTRFGYFHDEVVGQRFSRFLSPDSQNDLPQILVDFKAGRDHRSSCEIICKNGTVLKIVLHGRLEGESMDSNRLCHYLLHEFETE
jgi:PAS domain S-box-containing protein